MVNQPYHSELCIYIPLTLNELYFIVRVIRLVPFYVDSLDDIIPQNRRFSAQILLENVTSEDFD